MARLPVSDDFLEDVTKAVILVTLILVGLGVVTLSIFGVTKLPWTDGGQKMDKRYESCIEHGGSFIKDYRDEFTCNLPKKAVS